MGVTKFGERTVPGDPENDGRYDSIARSLRMGWDDLDWWLDFSQHLSWRYASTMDSTPHSYVIRNKTCPPQEYIRAFGVIRTFGTPGMFFNRTQIYLTDPDPLAGPLQKGRRWWLMSSHFWQSKSLNQAVDGKTYGNAEAPVTARPSDLTGMREPLPLYDTIGAFYEDCWKEDTLEDRQRLWKMCIGDTNAYQPTVLDAGAGTGSTLQAKITTPRKVTAIDPSQAMLNDLVTYHPTVGKVANATVEEFPEPRIPFDMVTASAGSASYFTDDEIDKLIHLATGRVVLSFYAPTHRPSLHDALGFDLPTSALDHATELTDRVIETDRYTYCILEGRA